MGARHEKLAAEIIHHNSGVGVIDVVIDGRRAAFSGSAVIADEMRCILAIALAKSERSGIERAAKAARDHGDALRQEADDDDNVTEATRGFRASSEAYRIAMKILSLE